MSEAGELNAAMLTGLRARAGSDPRWRRLGDVSEMGVLSGVGWAAWLTGIGVRPRRVPGAAWSKDVIGGDHGLQEVAVVACPCGNEPTVECMDAPKLCRPEVEQNLCQRTFFFDGEHVWCFNSPEITPSADGPTIVSA